MSRPILTAITLGFIFTLAPSAAALYMERKHEEFGPAARELWKPDRDGRYNLCHAPGRCYWRHSNSFGFGNSHDENLVACQGDAEIANESVKGFASLPFDSKEIWLFPGPGRVQSLDGKVTISCDWQMLWRSDTQVPRGEIKLVRTSNSAFMTLFIARAGPMAAPGPKIPAWIKDLNDDRFAARQRAFRALADLEDAALPALRQALLKEQVWEQRLRLEQLLRRLQSIHLGLLKLPKGIPVICLDELLEREQKNWRSGDAVKTWRAAGKICEWAEHSETTLPLLVEMLKDERESIRKQAVRTFGRLGNRAAKVLPALQTAVDQAPGSLREDLRRAMQEIEKGPAVNDVEASWSRNRALRRDIAAFCRSLK